MASQVSRRTLSVIAGVSYLFIFFLAIFANFFVLEKISQDPQIAVTQSLLLRFGIVAFLTTVIFDIIVAWAFQRLYHEHYLSILSTCFRLTHAIIMGIAVFKLAEITYINSSDVILSHIRTFNIIWLIGLLFFGIHLVLFAKIIRKPRLVSVLLTIAGLMYILDSIANFTLPNYANYQSIFLAVVASTSIMGEMSLTVWLLLKGGRN